MGESSELFCRFIGLKKEQISYIKTLDDLESDFTKGRMLGRTWVDSWITKLRYNPSLEYGIESDSFFETTFTFVDHNYATEDISLAKIYVIVRFVPKRKNAPAEEISRQIQNLTFRRSGLLLQKEFTFSDLKKFLSGESDAVSIKSLIREKIDTQKRETYIDEEMNFYQKDFSKIEEYLCSK